MISTVGCLFIMTTATAQEEQKQEVQNTNCQFTALAAIRPSRTRSRTAAQKAAQTAAASAAAPDWDIPLISTLRWV